MNLKPAIHTPEGLIVGEENESHKIILKKHKIEESGDDKKGFTPNGKIFLSRLQSVEFLRKYEPAIYKKIKDEAANGLHTHMYAKAIGIDIKKMDISKKNILVIDRGLYTYSAEALGEKANHVWYYLSESNPYPDSPKAQIGTGLDTIERVYNVHDYINRADDICFFDCYDSDWQIELRKRGHNVFGAHGSEKFELDKEFFFQFLINNNMHIPDTFKIEGLDELVDYLKDKKDKWLKQNYFRGDYESYHYKNANQAESWFDDLKARMGQRAKTMKTLVQDAIENSIEPGWDGFCLNGKYTKNGMVGYEIKDQGFCSKIFPETPKILADINNKFSKSFEELGYYGHFSTEYRITDNGDVYPLDWTHRCPSPPGELMTMIYTNYAEVVDSLACGELPEPEYDEDNIFGAEIMLYSSWYESHELCVEFPKECAPYIKLKNNMKKGDHYAIIPNNNGGYFGAVAATGKSVKEATEKCLEIVQEIDAYQMTYDKNVFAEAEGEIDKGAKHGLSFDKKG